QQRPLADDLPRQEDRARLAAQGHVGALLLRALPLARRRHRRLQDAARIRRAAPTRPARRRHHQHHRVARPPPPARPARRPQVGRHLDPAPRPVHAQEAARPRPHGPE
ncbi:hypothetical protein LOZ03_006844, partial [Ophidiomyces ophidiicola]